MRTALKTHRLGSKIDQLEELMGDMPQKRQKTEAPKPAQPKNKKVVLGKRTNTFVATSALIAAGMTFLDNVNHSNGASQALVEVKSEFMSLAALNDPDFGKPLLGPDYVHPGEGLPLVDPSEFNLNDIYQTFDLRDSYLQRQAMPLAAQADSIMLRTDDYETRTCNIWRSQDQSLAPQQALVPSQEVDFYTGLSHEDRVSVLSC